MITVGSYEAKTHLAQLLEKVSRGEKITITKHGVPVAKLVPVQETEKMDTKEVIRRIRELRKGNRLDGLSIREMIEEGRRF